MERFADIHKVLLSKTKSKSKQKLDNFGALQQLKQLQHSLLKNNVFITNHTKHQFLDDAYNLYRQIYGASNYHVINTLLNWSFKYEQPSRIFVMWPDIKSEVRRQTPLDTTPHISFSLLLKCCIESENIPKCLEVLQWIEQSDYRLKIHDLFIRKLLSTNSQHLTVTELRYIERLLNEKFLENNDKFIKSALIAAYGRCHSLQDAVRAFQSTLDADKDIYVISAMMKVCIDHHQYQDALALYQSTNVKHDDVSNMLALRACIHTKNIELAQRIIESAIHLHANADHQLMSTLIEFHGIAKQLDKAVQIFSAMTQHKRNQSICMYNAMMTAYMENAQHLKVLQLFEQIPHTLEKDTTAYLLTIKACSNLDDYHKGQCIIDSMDEKHYSDVAKTGHLINFYGHFHQIENAQSIFDSIEDQDKDIMNTAAMMSAYMNNDLNQSALDLYDEIAQKQCFPHDDVSHSLAVKACGKIRNFGKGKQIHDSCAHHLTSKELKNTLIDFYGKMNDIPAAESVFESIDTHNRDHVSIGSMMKAYIHNHCDHQALLLYDRNVHDLKVNDVCTMLAIKACTNIGNELKGRQLISAMDMDNKATMQTKTAVIDFYSAFGDIAAAKRIFNSIEECQRNDGIVCAMMKAYHQAKEYQRVLEMFDAHQCTKDAAITLALKACANIGTMDTLEIGKRIHADLCMDACNIHVYNELIAFYGHFKQYAAVKGIFASLDEIKIDQVCINTTLSALIHCDDNESALALYDGLSADHRDERSHMLAIKACGNLGKHERGKQIHEYIKDTVDDNNIHVKTGLIEFYGNCLDIQAAERMFDSIANDQQNIVTVGAMMKAYAINEKYEELLFLYDNMSTLHGSLKPDYTAHMLAIKACGQTMNYQKGKAIHNHIYFDIAENDIQMKTALMDFYGHCQDIQTVLEMFGSIKDEYKNIVCIGAMMNAYFINKMYAECIRLFQDIASFNHNRIKPDILTYRLVLAACGKQPHNFETKKQIHEQMKNDSDAHCILNDVTIQSNLINMYAQNGMIETCQDIFDEYLLKTPQEKQSLIVWNTMLQAYAQNALLNDVKSLFRILQQHSTLKPDMYTYPMVLSAMSHAGEIESAEHIWLHEIDEVAEKEIKYNEAVISSLIDGCSRKGYLHKAYEYLRKYEKMASNATATDSMWRSILSGCIKYGNKTLAQHIYDEYKLKFVDSTRERDANRISSAALILANLYASQQEFEKVEEIRKEAIEKELVNDGYKKRFVEMLASTKQKLYEANYVDPSRLQVAVDMPVSLHINRSAKKFEDTAHDDDDDALFEVMDA